MKPGKIILLNGASSAGKTCLLRALQDALPEPYLEAGLDKFIWMLPRRYLDRPLWDEVMGRVVTPGPVGHHLVATMHQTIALLADTGWNVLADHVLVEPAWLDDCVERFALRDALLVGVRCPLAVLEERERARKDRTLGQARLYHERVHAHGVYDLEVDTSLHSPQECARQVCGWLDAGHTPVALRRLESIRKEG